VETRVRALEKRIAEPGISETAAEAIRRFLEYFSDRPEAVSAIRTETNRLAQSSGPGLQRELFEMAQRILDGDKPSYLTTRAPMREVEQALQGVLTEVVSGLREDHGEALREFVKCVAQRGETLKAQ